MRDIRYRAVIVLLVVLSATISQAANPPKYLSVPKFKSCLSVQQHDGFTTLCLPAKKPTSCPKQSWKELSGFQGVDQVPRCR